MPRKCLGNVLEMYWKCPEHVLEISRKFPARKYPGNVSEMSLKCPGDFLEISSNVHGNVKEIPCKMSCKFNSSGYVRSIA